MEENVEREMLPQEEDPYMNPWRRQGSSRRREGSASGRGRLEGGGGGSRRGALERGKGDEESGIYHREIAVGGTHNVYLADLSPPRTRGFSASTPGSPPSYDEGAARPRHFSMSEQDSVKDPELEPEVATALPIAPFQRHGAIQEAMRARRAPRKESKLASLRGVSGGYLEALIDDEEGNDGDGERPSTASMRPRFSSKEWLVSGEVVEEDKELSVIKETIGAWGRDADDGGKGVEGGYEEDIMGEGEVTRLPSDYAQPPPESPPRPETVETTGSKRTPMTAQSAATSHRSSHHSPQSEDNADVMMIEEEEGDVEEEEEEEEEPEPEPGRLMPGITVSISADVCSLRRPVEFADMVRKDVEEALQISGVRAVRIGAPIMPLLRGPVPGTTEVDLLLPEPEPLLPLSPCLSPALAKSEEEEEEELEARRRKEAEHASHSLSLQMESKESKLRSGSVTRGATAASFSLVVDPFQQRPRTSSPGSPLRGAANLRVGDEVQLSGSGSAGDIVVATGGFRAVGLVLGIEKGGKSLLVMWEKTFCVFALEEDMIMARKPQKPAAGENRVRVVRRGGGHLEGAGEILGWAEDGATCAVMWSIGGRVEDGVSVEVRKMHALNPKPVRL